jgi:hypothetical protein
MEDIQITDMPVMFNAWKHHRNFIMSCVVDLSGHLSGKKLIDEGLAVMGNSVTDLYLGKLSPNEISTEIIGSLKSGGNFDTEDYSLWLSQNKGYRMITLSDSSRWTLRLGNDKDRYIHIHPGRYSPHSIRIKALTLKTIVASLYLCRIKNEIAEPGIINQARLELLQESPLKDAGNISGIVKAFKLIAGDDVERDKSGFG